MISDETLRAVLADYLQGYGPCGLEDDIRNRVKRSIQSLCDECYVDELGNLIAKITGNQPGATPIRIVGHLDEISMIVKRINPDGSLHLRGMGCLYPQNIGQGPVQILAAKQVPGILSFGCTHISSESEAQYAINPHPDKLHARAVDWNDVRVFTGLSVEALLKLHVGPGTRVVIDRARRHLFEIGDFYSAYYMDDRAPLTAMWGVMKYLNTAGQRPDADLHFVFTVNEETNADGASYALQRLPDGISISLDIAPVEAEYQIELSDAPVLAYQDGFSAYDYHETERLREIASGKQIKVQRAVFENLGSDVSIAKKYGHVSKALFIGIPTANTHGFEIIHKNSISQCIKLIVSYLTFRQYCEE